ncbi:unnamed protein product [Prunus armeniaca]
MLAAMHGKISCVEMLLDAGATALVFFLYKKRAGMGDSPRWGWGRGFPETT